MRTLPAAVSSLVDAVVSGPPVVGRVLTVLPSVVYVEAGEAVLALETSAGLGLPIAVRVAALNAPWDVAPGSSAQIGEGEVVLGSLTLRVVRSWAAPRVRLGSSDVRCAVPSAVSLIGRGPGLTPAGDDRLCGTLLVLRALGSPDLATLRTDVLANLDRTSSVSGSLLRAACDGYALAVVRDLVHAVVDDDRDAVRRLVPQVERLGHTSGRDLVAGITSALDAQEGSLLARAH